jgi:hypothetical protein
VFHWKVSGSSSDSNEIQNLPMKDPQSKHALVGNCMLLQCLYDNLSFLFCPTECKHARRQHAHSVWIRALEKQMYNSALVNQISLALKLAVWILKIAHHLIDSYVSCLAVYLCHNVI